MKQLKQLKNKKGRGAFITIVFSVACLAVLIVILCAGVYYSSMNRYLKQQIEKNDDANLKQLSSSYELFLKNTIDSSMVFIENDARNVMSLYDKREDEYKKQMYRHLESLAQMTGFIDSVYFYDRNTQMVYLSSGISYERGDFYDGAWLDSLKEGRDAWEILSARKLEAPFESEKNIIPIVIRYPFASLESPYLYVINMRADQLFQYLLKSIYNSANKNFKVINDNQNIFISSDSRENFKNMEDFPYLAENRERLQSGDSGSFLAGKGGKRRIVHYTSSSQYGWIYLSEMNYEEVARQLREPLLLILGLTIPVLALSLLLCVVFSKRLYRPVKSLIEFVMSERTQEGTDRKENEYEQLKEHFKNTYSENQSLQDKVMQNKDMMKKQFFYNLLAKNYYSGEEIDSKMADIGISPDSVFAVAFFCVNRWREYLEAFDREEQSLWEYAFENIACEAASEYGKPVFVGVDANRFALIIAFPMETQPEEAEGAAGQAAEQITASLQAFLRYSFSAGVSLASQGIYTVNKAYEQAREAFASLEEECGKVALYSCMEGENRKLHYSYEDEICLTEMIRSGDGRRAADFLNTMYENFRRDNGGRREGISYFAFLLFTAIMKQGNELGFSQEEMFGGRDMTRLWEISVARKDEKEMLAELTEVVESICGRITGMREGVSNSQVRQITEYIKANYNKPITLGDIAEHIDVNQSTVSRLMTQNLKMSTVDYMNQVRIEKAVQLIGEGRKKVAEISEEAGFNNAHYFIRVFKKLTGKTPGSMIEEMEDQK